VGARAAFLVGRRWRTRIHSMTRAEETLHQPLNLIVGGPGRRRVRPSSWRRTLASIGAHAVDADTHRLIGRTQQNFARDGMTANSTRRSRASSSMVVATLPSDVRHRRSRLGEPASRRFHALSSRAIARAGHEHQSHCAVAVQVQVHARASRGRLSPRLAPGTSRSDHPTRLLFVGIVAISFDASSIGPAIVVSSYATSQARRAASIVARGMSTIVATARYRPRMRHGTRHSATHRCLPRCGQHAAQRRRAGGRCGCVRGFHTGPRRPRERSVSRCQTGTATHP
jgi:hypothetical protein